jgi:hypothetical protein
MQWRSEPTPADSNSQAAASEEARSRFILITMDELTLALRFGAALGLGVLLGSR